MYRSAIRQDHHTRRSPPAHGFRGTRRQSSRLIHPCRNTQRRIWRTHSICLRRQCRQAVLSLSRRRCRGCSRLSRRPCSRCDAPATAVVARRILAPDKRHTPMPLDTKGPAARSRLPQIYCPNGYKQMGAGQSLQRPLPRGRRRDIAYRLRRNGSRTGDELLRVARTRNRHRRQHRYQRQQLFDGYVDSDLRLGQHGGYIRR